MHFHLPKPLHGWREFAGEVGIIVVGVLIALAGEQIVESINAQKEVREFRQAANSEMRFNLAAYGDRMEQSACTDRRLDQLEAWLAEWNAGRRPVLTDRITRPTYLSARTSVWGSRTADLASQLGLEQRVAYARFYDLVGLFSETVDREREVWIEIQDYSHAQKLDDTQLMKLGGLIDRARQYQYFFRIDQPPFKKTASQLGVRTGDAGDEASWDRSLCRPLRWREG